jgi:hypothetical protein
LKWRSPRSGATVEHEDAAFPDVSTWPLLAPLIPAIDWSTVHTTRHDVRTPAGRSTSVVASVLHALQASDEPRRLDTLAHDTGQRDAHDVSRAMAVLLAQGLATRTPRGYAATSLGRRAAASAPGR